MRMKSCSALPSRALPIPTERIFDSCRALHYFSYFLCGPIAQLVERYTGSVEVSGSTPLRSILFRFKPGYARIRIDGQECSWTPVVLSGLLPSQPFVNRTGTPFSIVHNSTGRCTRVPSANSTGPLAPEKLRVRPSVLASSSADELPL